MQILADENVDYSIFQQLLDDGFEIKHIKDLAPGIDDEKILKMAQDNQSIILQKIRILENWCFV